MRFKLIMVAFAGLMTGLLFTTLIKRQPDSLPESSQRPVCANVADASGGWGSKKRAQTAYEIAQSGAVVIAGGGASQQPQAQVELTEPNTALALIEQWLPVVWDLSAATAQGSQEKAMAYMTPECATAYRQSVWTADMAKTIQDSGLQSSFTAKKVSAGENRADGSVVVFVDGEQTLKIAGKKDRTRPVKMEYLVRKFLKGLRVAGINEGTHS
jgi:hypothetical protein